MSIQDVVKRNAIWQAARAFDHKSVRELPNKYASGQLIVSMADSVQDCFSDNAFVESWDIKDIMRGGTIVDATIINAPSSTKNAEKKRDPEMHQTKKGNEWRFGMKCHVGVDAGTGLVHTIEVTPANTHDITVASKLIRSDDEVVYGDFGFVGIQKRPEIKENEHLASIDYRIVRRPGSLPRVSDNAIDWERFIDHRKASIRCKVENVFRIVKRQFGYAKTAYRGLQKNANRLYALFLSSNLYMLARAGRSLQKLEIA